MPLPNARVPSWKLAAAVAAELADVMTADPEAAASLLASACSRSLAVR
jgi:hypothetical protein